MRVYLFALTIFSLLGCVCFAIAREQTFRGPDYSRPSHTACVAYTRDNSAEDDCGYFAGYPIPRAIDDPDDPDDQDNN
jgi:hypothetical protein